MSTRSADTHGASEVVRLRDDIVSGRTGDKVAAPDPAAAPLGTDDEAAGTPAGLAEATAARAAETRLSAVRPAIAADATKPGERAGGRMALFGIWAFVACMLAALLYVVLR